MSIMGMCESIYNYRRDFLDFSYAPYVTRGIADPKAALVYIKSDETCPITLFPFGRNVIQLNCKEPPHYFSYSSFIEIENKSHCSICRTMTQPQMATLLVQQEIDSKEQDEKAAATKKYRPVTGLITVLKPELEEALKSSFKRRSFAILNVVQWAIYGASQGAIFAVGCIDITLTIALKVFAVVITSPLYILPLLITKEEDRESILRQINRELNKTSKQIANVITVLVIGLGLFVALIITPATISMVITQTFFIYLGVAALFNNISEGLKKPASTPRQIWNGDFPQTNKGFQLCSYESPNAIQECEALISLRQEANKLTLLQRQALTANTPANNAERTRLGIDPHGELNAAEFVAREQKTFTDNIKWDLPPLSE